ncbi:MAG: aminopeptidase N, partial [Egibacteraceae bacterium]
AHAFEAAVSGSADGEPLALATQRTILGGFWQADQEELLAEYAEQRWVEVLERIWAERSVDEALGLTAGVYPATQVSRAVVAAADRALAGDVLPPAGRRTVTEGRDDTLRALRARAADVE